MINEIESYAVTDPEDEVLPGAEEEPTQREYTVELGGRVFEIEPPNTDTGLRILNRIGILAMNAEQLANRVVKNSSWRAVLFGLLGAINRDQLVRMGAVVLQFEDETKGRKWLNELGDDLRVTPIVNALFYNVEQSKDLMEALSAFFEGVVGAVSAAGDVLGSLNISIGAQAQASEDGTGSSESAES